MWKKEGSPDLTTAIRPEAAAPARPVVPARMEPAPIPDRSALPGVPHERATIGRSITIRGEVTGDEDLVVQGRVEGSVNLKHYAVTVGSEGEVRGDIIGRVVIVEGRVEGNLSAEEQVILRSSARVHGDIAAPRLVLEDGARFRGGVDMGESAERNGRTEAAPHAAAPRKAGSGRTAPAAAELASEMERSGASDEQKSASTRKAEGVSHAAPVTG